MESASLPLASPSATKIESVESAILWQGKTPLWDVAKVTAYPVEFQQKGNNPTVYIYLTPYAPDELKEILRKMTAGYKREKQDVEIVREDSAIYTPLCDAHFVRIGNANGTPEAQRAWLDKYPELAQRAWLDKYPELKPGIVEHTFGGLRIDPPKPSDDDNSMLDISADLSGSIHVFQELYDPGTSKVVRVNMVH